MKLISTSLGRILLSGAAAILIFSSLASKFVPTVADFTARVFPVEKNYDINGSIGTPSVSLSEDVFVKTPGESTTEWEIYSKLTGDNDLINNNTSVFIYKTYKDGSSVLIDKIDSKPGVNKTSKINSNASKIWTVLYVINNGGESAVLKANYVFAS